MKELDELIELLRRSPKPNKVGSIQAAEQFKKLHARATKYIRSTRRTTTQTLSLLSELKEYQ